MRFPNHSAQNNRGFCSQWNQKSRSEFMVFGAWQDVTSRAGPTEASPGRRGQSTAASMLFASFPPCLSPCARHLCLISQSPVNGQLKALLLGYFEQLLKEAELDIVPMSLPPPSSVSTLSLFFLSLCRKLGSQWLVSATSQTSLLEDGPSASDYPLLLPNSNLLPSVLRAQSWVSGSWKLLWRSSHTSYLPDEQNNGEHFETFFLLCFFTVFMCVAYACARAHVCVHICMQVLTQIWRLEVRAESPLISRDRVSP